MKRQKQMHLASTNSGKQICQLKFQTSKFHALPMETKEDAPGVSRTDLKRTTQQYQTASAAGSVSEGHSGDTAMNSCIELNGKNPIFAPHQRRKTILSDDGFRGN